MLKCEICGYTTEKLLSVHLKKAHGLSKEDYLTDYPNSKIISDDYRQVLVDRNKSDKMRQAVAQKNKSDEMRQAVSRRNSDPDFIEKCKSGMNKTDVKMKQSQRMSERNRIMWQDENYRKYMCEKISDAQKIRMNTDIMIEKQRKVMQNNWNNDEIADKMLKAPTSKWKYAKNGVYHSNKFNVDISYKSTGELQFLELCDCVDSITDLKYESIHIHDTNTNKTYTPDFAVVQNGEKYLIEIKFDEHYTDSDFLTWKHDIAIKYCEDNNMRFCWLRRFVEIPQLIETKDLSIYALCRSKTE